MPDYSVPNAPHGTAMALMGLLRVIQDRDWLTLAGTIAVCLYAWWVIRESNRETYEP